MWRTFSPSAASTSLTRRSAAGPRNSAEPLRRTFAERALARAQSGISTRWSSASSANACLCGGGWPRKVKFSTFWFQKRRNNRAALKLLRKLLRKQGYAPDEIVTDGLASYGAALEALDCRSRHRPGRLRDNNRAENSHLLVRRRERKMQRFKSQGKPSASLPPTAPSTISSISSVTSFPDQPFAASGPTPREAGSTRPQQLREISGQEFRAPASVKLTIPPRASSRHDNASGTSQHHSETPSFLGSSVTSCVSLQESPGISRAIYIQLPA